MYQPAEKTMLGTCGPTKEIYSQKSKTLPFWLWSASDLSISKSCLIILLEITPIKVIGSFTINVVACFIVKNILTKIQLLITLSPLKHKFLFLDIFFKMNETFSKRTEEMSTFFLSSDMMPRTSSSIFGS